MVQEYEHTHRNTEAGQPPQPSWIVSWLTLGVSVCLAGLYWHHAGIMKGMRSAADKQTELIESQKTLTQQNYLATHRPRLHIAGIFTDGPNAHDMGMTCVYIRNRGANLAKEVLFDAVFTIKIDDIKQPDWIEKLNPTIRHGLTEISRGETVTYPIRQDAYPSAFNGRKIQGGEQDLMLIGRVLYKDEGGILRNTGFGWKYDSSHDEFVRPEKEDEYNYED
jgi:hypothetical protein